MGLILGALAGAGQQAADFADKQITQDQALERETHSSNLALDRAKALEIAKVELGNKERTAMVDRVRGAAEQIADEKLAPKRQGIVMEAQQDAAGTLVGPAQDPEQADAQLAQDRRGLVDRAMSDGSAGLRTGDITPKDAMGNASKLEINQIKMDNLLARAEDRNSTLKEVADVRAEAMRYGYELRLQAAQERSANGKIDSATGRMMITSEDANINANKTLIGLVGRQLEDTPKLVNGKPNPRRDELQKEIDDYKAEIKASMERKATYLDSKGIAGAKAPAAPKAGGEMGPPVVDTLTDLPAGVPPGSKQVGTSGGKPVYQSPDGKKWKVQ